MHYKLHSFNKIFSQKKLRDRRSICSKQQTNPKRFNKLCFSIYSFIYGHGFLRHKKILWVYNIFFMVIFNNV